MEMGKCCANGLEGTGPTSKKTLFPIEKPFRLRHSRKTFASNSCARPCSTRVGWGRLACGLVAVRVEAVRVGAVRVGERSRKKVGAVSGWRPKFRFFFPLPTLFLFCFSNFRCLSWNCGGLCAFSALKVFSPKTTHNNTQHTTTNNQHITHNTQHTTTGNQQPHNQPNPTQPSPAQPSPAQPNPTQPNPTQPNRPTNQPTTQL